MVLRYMLLSAVQQLNRSQTVAMRSVAARTGIQFLNLCESQQTRLAVQPFFHGSYTIRSIKFLKFCIGSSCQSTGKLMYRIAKNFHHITPCIVKFMGRIIRSFLMPSTVKLRRWIVGDFHSLWGHITSHPAVPCMWPPRFSWFQFGLYFPSVSAQTPILWFVSDFTTLVLTGPSLSSPSSSHHIPLEKPSQRGFLTVFNQVEKSSPRAG